MGDSEMWLDAVRSLWFSFKRRPARMGLTILQLSLGIGAMALVLNAFFGARGALQDSLRAMGENVYNVFIIPVREGEKVAVPLSVSGSGQVSVVEKGGSTVRVSSKPTYAFGQDDLEYLKENSSAIKFLSPIERSSEELVRVNERFYAIRMVGRVLPDYFRIGRVQILEGEFFTDLDLKQGKKVCIIGQTAARALFGSESPVGKEITFYGNAGLYERTGRLPGSGEEYLIIGVFNDTAVEGYSLAFGGVPIYAYIPFSRAEYTSNFMVELEAGQAGAAHAELKTLARQLRDAELDFTFNSVSEVLKYQMRELNRMSLFFGAFGMVALVIGAIGILSTMTVGLLERSRELGIRKALGASRRMIILQIIAESTLLSLAGGILGLILAAAVNASVVSAIFQSTPFAFPRALEVIPALISLGAAGAVGVIFGLYPAIQATRFSPVEVLRS